MIKSLGRLVCLCTGFVLLFTIHTQAQLKIFEPQTPRDSSYIISYYNNITLRTFFVNKYSGFSVFHKHRINYASNNPIGVGLGAVYKIYNINLTVSTPVPEVYESGRGKSRTIDLNSSIYGRRWVFDLYLNLYKGYYTPHPEYSRYILRSNLHNSTLGVNAHYLFNAERFSYRAFRVNDEWQHKSSGTFFLSLAAFYNDLYDADRIGLIPEEYSGGLPPSSNIYRKQSIAAGPGGGYAYNFVFNKNWFLLLSFSGRLMLDYGIEQALAGDDRHPIGLHAGTTMLGAIGYQTEYWGINISGSNTRNQYSTDLLAKDYSTHIGYFKLNFLYRLPHSKATRALVKPLDYLLRK